MTSLKDIHKGETGVIVLNGPSLNKIPLDWLNSHRNISSNHIYKLSGFKVQTYVLVDTSCLSTPVRVAYFADTLKNSERNIVWEKHLDKAPKGSIGLSRGGKDEFHPDVLTSGCGNYASTAWVCVQLAYLMGFDPVLFVGFDCDFDKPEGYHFYRDEPHDFTHHPPVQHHEWADKLIRHMMLARDAFEKDGRRIINCTEGSGCKMFEFGDYRDY